MPRGGVNVALARHPTVEQAAAETEQEELLERAREKRGHQQQDGPPPRRGRFPAGFMFLSAAGSGNGSATGSSTGAGGAPAAFSCWNGDGTGCVVSCPVLNRARPRGWPGGVEGRTVFNDASAGGVPSVIGERIKGQSTPTTQPLVRRLNNFPASSPLDAAWIGGYTFDFSRLPASVRPLVDAPPAARCALGVAIPVHNEEAGITATLAALAAQVDAAGRPLDPESYEVLVLANNCTDGTVARARRFAAAHPRLRLHIIEVLLAEPHAHVGAARRLVMDEAARRLKRLGRARGVIATTDGDTVVRPDWVAMNLREVARGGGCRWRAHRFHAGGGRRARRPGRGGFTGRTRCTATCARRTNACSAPTRTTAGRGNHHFFGATPRRDAGNVPARGRAAGRALPGRHGVRRTRSNASARACARARKSA